MTIKLKCDPSKLPAPKLPKPQLKELKPDTPWESLNRQKRIKKNREWRLVNRGVNNGSYGRPSFWTPEKNAIIAKMHSEGKTYEEIADEFGKTKESVRRQWYNIRDGIAPTK